MHKLRMPWGRMAYSHAGAGSLAMVFLHGAGCNSADWGNVVRHLPSSLQRVGVDFRGHGASDVPSDAFTIADLAADVVALLDALHLSQVILVGHSLGGMVAMVVASQARSVVGRVLLEGWTQLRAARAFSGDRLYGHLTPLSIRHIREKSDKTTNVFRPATWRAFWESVESFDGCPQLRVAGIPVFEVYGDIDIERTHSTESLLMIPSNPAVRLFWIGDAGHYLAHEKPLDVARICTQMLHRCEQQARWDADKPIAPLQPFAPEDPT